MKLNKMTSYAVRIVGRLYLENDIMTTKKIAETEDISLGVVMKLMGYLRHAGIVSSGLGRGGKSGGFRIASDLKDVTMYDVIMAVENEISMYPENDKDHYTGPFAKIYEEFERTNEKFINEMKKISLYDVINESL